MDRQVRAQFDRAAIVVYQAYPSIIAERALAAGTFVEPFKRDRMTWIKPSFRWMMYRSGWGTKPDQERVLAISMSRDGFERALAQASLSHFEKPVHGSVEAWRTQKESSPVRVQWDPERSILLEPLPQRAIQIGLSGRAVDAYVDQWITGIRDVTELARDIHADVRAGNSAKAADKLPSERPYPLPAAIRDRLGGTPPDARVPAGPADGGPAGRPAG